MITNSCSESNYIPLSADSSSTPIQPMLPLSKEIHIGIFNYLPIKDQASLSLTCRYAKVIADYSLCLRAKEYGYPSTILPTTTEAKQFLATLFRIVKALKKRKLLPKSEIHSVSITKSVLFIKRKTKRMNCEQTLLNISNSHLSLLAQLFTCKTIYKVKDIKSFHFFLLKQHPLIEFETAIGTEAQTKLNEALLLATQKSDYSAVKLLLNYNADPNIPAGNGSPPLHWAAQQGRTDIVESLLQKSALINAPGWNGKTALMFALEAKKAEAVKLLLEKGADPEIADQNGYTPLVWASKKGMSDIASLLLDYNADPNIPAGNGSPPLHYASQKGHTNIVESLLLRGALINAPGWNGKTALLFALEAMKAKAVKLLLEKGADPEIADQNGYTPLVWASQRWMSDIASLLLG